MIHELPDPRTSEGQRALFERAQVRGESAAAVTHLAALCALGGTAVDWLTLAERVEGEPAVSALAEALDAMAFEDVDAQLPLRVAERAYALGDMDLAGDGLAEALLRDPPDTLRRPVIRLLRLIYEGGGAPEGEPVRAAGRNDPCPCGSGKKYKRCHGAGSQSPSPRPHASEAALLLRLVRSQTTDSEETDRMLDALRRWARHDSVIQLLGGIVADGRGERAEALRAFRKVAADTSGEVEAHRELYAHLTGRVVDAPELVLDVLGAARPPEDVLTRTRLGELFIALGYPHEASLTLSDISAKAEGRERDDALRALALARSQRGEQLSALAALDQISQPTAADLAGVAIAAAWAGDDSLEARCARLETADLGDTDTARMAAARTLLDAMGEDGRTEAERMLRETLARRVGGLARGIAALVAGANERAARLLGDALRPGGEHWRAEALDALGRGVEAAEARRACVAADADSGDDLALQLGCALVLDGPAGFDRLLREREGLRGIAVMREEARRALRSGEIADAERISKQLLAQAPRHVEVLLLAAELAQARGDLGAALGHLDAAIALHPKRHRVRLARAQLLRDAGRNDEALETLQELVRESPDNAGYHIALAELFEARGDAKRARQQWRAAHRLAPSAPEVARAIGRLEGEDRALQRSREEAERSVRALLGPTADELRADTRAALVGAEQDWNTLEADDDHSTVVTQLAKATEIELMSRLFAPFREAAPRGLDTGGEGRGFAQWYRGEIDSLSLGEMQHAIASLSREMDSRLFQAFAGHVGEVTGAPWGLAERLGAPLRALVARRNAAVHKEVISRAEADDSRRAVLGSGGRKGILAEVVTLFGR